MYYGTEQQHARVKQLVDEFREPIQSERVVYEFYKLRFADSEKTAEVIRGMITNTVPAGESPLVPGQGGGGAGQRRGGFQPFLTPEGIIAAIDGGGSGIGEIVASDQVFVLPDKGNNQVIVKAPQRLQPQFQRLIERLDQRRSQVYIDAKIVVVNDDEDFRLGIESQLINAEGTGGALRTIFDGSIAATAGTGGILGRPTVGTGPGINFAIIKSNMVPLVIDAFARTTDTRIVANPQLLVDDNEEAEISSIRQEATTTQTSVGGGTNPQFQTSFGGYQDAGPRLKVKPRISSGDLLSLEYEIELSSFDGTSSNGIPPPRSENKVSSKSATIPSDSTIVVGGLTLDDTRKVIFKVPLLGDIPLLGEAFKRTTDTKRRQTVYVFITPRIMRDPVGNDLRLFSRGPAAGVKVNTELPPITPEMIEIVAPGSRQGGGAPSEPAPGEPGNGAPGNGEPGNGEPAPGSEPAPATSGRSGNVPNLRFPSPTPASSAPASSTATRPTTPTPAPAPTGEASSPSRSQ
jgi:general secretion pathway protein D